MKKSILLMVFLQAFNVKASEVVYSPSNDAVAYSMVSIDPKRLKTSEANALKAWPGAECKSYANLNGQVLCPGIWNNLNTYDLAEGFTKITDPKDPSKALRIDGVKQTFASNFFVITFCADPNNCVAPPARKVNFSMQVPTTEFGFEYRPDRPDLTYPFIKGFDVTVNGADLGFWPTDSASGVQYFGVSAPEGIQSVTVVPVWYNSDSIGPLLIDKLIYK